MIAWILDKYRKFKVKRAFRSGVATNPLTKIRNKPCICGSGFKAKRCCGRLRYLPKNVASAVDAAIEYERRRESKR